MCAPRVTSPPDAIASDWPVSSLSPPPVDLNAFFPFLISALAFASFWSCKESREAVADNAVVFGDRVNGFGRWGFSAERKLFRRI